MVNANIKFPAFIFPYKFHLEINLGFTKKQNFWLTKPFGAANQRLGFFWQSDYSSVNGIRFVLWPVPHIYRLLTLSQTTYYRLFQTQRVCRRQFQNGWKWKKVLQAGRKHCGKRRNCSLRAISPFPTVVSKGLYCRHVKTRPCLSKG